MVAEFLAGKWVLVHKWVLFQGFLDGGSGLSRTALAKRTEHEITKPMPNQKTKCESQHQEINENPTQKVPFNFQSWMSSIV